MVNFKFMVQLQQQLNQFSVEAYAQTMKNISRFNQYVGGDTQIIQKSCFQQQICNNSTSSSENNSKSNSSPDKNKNKLAERNQDNQNQQSILNLQFLSSKLQKLENQYFQMEKIYIKKIKSLKDQMKAQNSDSKELIKILTCLKLQNQKQKKQIQIYMEQIKQSCNEGFDSNQNQKKINISYYAGNNIQQKNQKKKPIRTTLSPNLRLSGSGRLLTSLKLNKYNVNYASYGHQQFLKSRKKAVLVKGQLNFKQ